MSHTDSDWKAESVGTRSLEDGSEAEVYEVRNSGGDLICETVDACHAELIAAAPDLLDLLCLAMPYVEEAEKDPAYKTGVVRKFAKQIRALLDRLDKQALATEAVIRSATDDKPISHADLDHFMRCVKQGRHRGCSGGEKSARKVALAVLDDGLSLDGSAIDGLIKFIRIAKAHPTTARDLVGI